MEEKGPAWPPSLNSCEPLWAKCGRISLLKMADLKNIPRKNEIWVSLWRGSAVGQAKFNAGLLLLLGTRGWFEVVRSWCIERFVFCTKNWDFVKHIFCNVLRSGVSLEICFKRIFLWKLKRLIYFIFFLYFQRCWWCCSWYGWKRHARRTCASGTCSWPTWSTWRWRRRTIR